MTNNLENTHKHAESCKGTQGASQRECRGNRQESAGAGHPKQGERHVQRPDLGQGIEGVLRSKAETQRGEGGGGGRPCPQARTGLQGQQGCRAGSGDREEAEGGPKRPGCRQGEDVQPPAPGLGCLSLAPETLHYKKKKKRQLWRWRWRCQNQRWKSRCGTESCFGEPCAGQGGSRPAKSNASGAERGDSSLRMFQQC